MFDSPLEAEHAASAMRFLSAFSAGQFIYSARPIIATAADVSGTHVISAHHHPPALLLYSVNGALCVRIGRVSWAITPRTRVWVPCGTPHQVVASAGVFSCSVVFASPPYRDTILTRVPVTVGALPHGPILEAATFGAHDRPGSAELRWIGVLQGSLQRMPVEAMPVPLPGDARIRNNKFNLAQTGIQSNQGTGHQLSPV